MQIFYKPAVVVQRALQGTQQTSNECCQPGDGQHRGYSPPART